MNGSGDPLRRGRRRSAGGTLDQWMTAGRQLVDGVSGARPGSRSPGRSGSGRGGEGRSLQGLGRWMEDRLDWFMEGEDDWPEPWQEPMAERRSVPRTVPRAEAYDTPPSGRTPRSPAPAIPEIRPGRGEASAQPQPRRSLEAISRRAAPLLPPAPAQPEEWPDLQGHGAGSPSPEPEIGAPTNRSSSSRRPLPRSSRSRP